MSTLLDQDLPVDGSSTDSSTTPESNPRRGPQPSWLHRISSARNSCLLGALALLLIAITAARIVAKHQTPGPFNPAAQGYCDFHNGVYFPSLAFINGFSPYSQEFAQSYPVERSMPFYSPFVLALHSPWYEYRC